MNKKRYKKIHSGKNHDYYILKNCTKCYGKGIIVTTYPQAVKIKGKWTKTTYNRCSCVIVEKWDSDVPIIQKEKQEA